jgi:ATP-dependent Clp protease ATP-binding subunit ClpC
MYERLSGRVDKIIKLSQEIAREYDQDYVGTEHLLLAILQEGTGVGALLLNEQGIGLARVKEVVDRLMLKSAEETWVFGRLPGTPHFRNVMAIAIEEARQFESKEVCSEHMLLALAREEGSVAQATLLELGIKAGTLRAKLRAYLDAQEGKKGVSEPGAS